VIDFQRNTVGLRIKPSGRYMQAIRIAKTIPNKIALNLNIFTSEWLQFSHRKINLP
jgi:hypothetical protein